MINASVGSPTAIERPIAINKIIMSTLVNCPMKSFIGDLPFSFLSSFAP